LAKETMLWKKFLKNPEFITITYKISKRMSLPADVTTLLLKCQEPT
jgi:hypothetical protein